MKRRVESLKSHGEERGTWQNRHKHGRARSGEWASRNAAASLLSFSPRRGPREGE